MSQAALLVDRDFDLQALRCCVEVSEGTRIWLEAWRAPADDLENAHTVLLHFPSSKYISV